ncbi:hypothetical protein L596_014969 [Steinernema carpocapsae]|uniref:Uncharacterized protein n=1 Tax=Steinernema carpocapsae TaxID=34508 RepID=A0A4U5NET3_STECR|nr:hypothetical protein L596_014969 [Steinernema carpocapsae]
MDSDAADASEVPNHDQFPSIEDNSWYYNHSSLKPFNPLDQVEFGNVLNYDNPVSDGRFDEDEDETGENGSTEDTGTSQSQYESRIMLGDPGGAESKPSIKLVVKRKFPLVNNGEEPSGSKARLDSHQLGQSLASKQEVEDSQRENSRFASLTKKLDMEEWRKLSSQLKMADRIGNAIRLCEVLRICIKVRTENFLLTLKLKRLSKENS